MGRSVPGRRRGEFKLARQTGGSARFAWVVVRLDPLAEASKASSAVRAALGPVGSRERPPEAWIAAALVGARRGLEVARARGHIVTIERVIGMHVDTTQAAMEMAATMAVFDALAWPVPDDVRSALEQRAWDQED